MIETYPIICPVLVIKATKIATAIKHYRTVSIIDTIQKKNTKCVIKTLRTDHDVHKGTQSCGNINKFFFK